MATSRIADVTTQILDHHRIYGASDSTNQNYTASSRCLNYANGASIQKPEFENISNVPAVINYKDSVGLFGAENHFVKVNVKIQNPVTVDVAIQDYFPAELSSETVVNEDPYTYVNNGGTQPGQAFINTNADNNSDDSCGTETICINSYEPALMSNNVIAGLSSYFFKVELENLKTGNIYIDSWLDVRLYNKYREEHPYDVMYIKYNEPFYIGFHARNTKQLPYNVTCRIGEEGSDSESNLPALLKINDIDPRYLATKR